MSDDDILKARARQVLADLHGCGVTAETALEVVLDALRQAWDDGKREAWDSADWPDE